MREPGHFENLDEDFEIKFNGHNTENDYHYSVDLSLELNSSDRNLIDLEQELAKDMATMKKKNKNVFEEAKEAKKRIFTLSSQLKSNLKKDAEKIVRTLDIHHTPSTQKKPLPSLIDNMNTGKFGADESIHDLNRLQTDENVLPLSQYDQPAINLPQTLADLPKT